MSETKPNVFYFIGMDGYSRCCVFLRCSTNNKAVTVLECFQEATAQWGIPSRVRSDYGGENVLVADLMLQLRGTNRGSFITRPMRTAHNLSPVQLFVSRCMELYGSQSTVVRELFDDRQENSLHSVVDPPSFGVEIDESEVNEETDNHVTVPFTESENMDNITEMGTFYVFVD